MAFFKTRLTLLVAAAALATAACGGNSSVPSLQSGATNVAPQVAREGGGAMQPLDNTSILKRIKKDVVIGSTVDPTNGDTGPHALSVVQAPFGLKQGDLVVCNFSDKTGAAGKGTTVDILAPKTNSTPSTFAQNADIEGCVGDATTTFNYIYAAGMTSGDDVGFKPSGNVKKVYGAPLKRPFSDADIACPYGQSSCLYTGESIATSDADTGAIFFYGVSGYAAKKTLEVAKGFAINKKSGWSALGPSGLAYNYFADTLYIADGIDNTVVGFTHASALLLPDEIIVKRGGKTFKCKFHGHGDPCGKLIFAGKPLDAPVAMTALPNGNLIVANTAHNTLVEISAAGTLLDTRPIDKSATAHIFGLAATGTKDSNTVIYYTTTKDNTLHELEQ